MFAILHGWLYYPSELVPPIGTITNVVDHGSCFISYQLVRVLLGGINRINLEIKFPDLLVCPCRRVL